VEHVVAYSLSSISYMASQDNNPYKRYKGLLKGKKMSGAEVHKLAQKAAQPIKHTGSFQGKSNTLGHGGRAAQMKARGVPQGVIGMIARREGAAPGGPNYHGKKKSKVAEPEKQDLGMAMKKKRKGSATIRMDGGKDPEHKRKAPTVRMDGGKDPEHKRKASKRKTSTMTVPKGGMSAAGTSQRLPGGKQITNPSWVNAPKSNVQVGLPTPKMGGTSAPSGAMSVSTPMKKRKNVKKK
jgi:hypothetical protein